MIAPTMTLEEIANVLRMPLEKTKRIMKANGLTHDGTSQMNYESNKVNPLIDKKLQGSQLQGELSSTHYIDSPFVRKSLGISGRHVNDVINHYGLDGMSRDLFRKNKRIGLYDDVLELFPTPMGLTKDELRVQYTSKKCDRWIFNQACQLGIITPNDEGLFADDTMQSIPPLELTRKTIEEMFFSTEKVYEILDVNRHMLAQFLEDEGVVKNENGEWNGKDILEIAMFNHLFKDAVDIIVRVSKDSSPRPVVRTWDSSKAHVVIPKRQIPPEYVGFHLGPTNSGKTYQALEDLCKEYEANPQGSYVYSGPLRMLAYEVYTKMVERYGVEAVGFITGEESINPDAPIIAATVEMTPMNGDLLIVDEAHWIHDDERGHYWARLLMSCEYKRIHIIAAEEAAEGLSFLVRDSPKIESRVFRRRTGISYDGELAVSKIKPKSAVVCFSRKAVYAVYDELLKNGIKANVLYGALPVDVRKTQIKKFEDGEYDVVVTTNVIGHGINLPIDNVVFAGTERFDGQNMIEIPEWEAGQISGRAGRYGLSDKGRVHVLTGIECADADTMIVRDGVNVAAGRMESGLEVTSIPLFPTFAELGVEEDEQEFLFVAVSKWRELADFNEYESSPMNVVRKNFDQLAAATGSSFDSLWSGDEDEEYSHSLSSKKSPWVANASTLWNFVSGPFDSRCPVFYFAANWLNSKNRESSNEMRHAFSSLCHFDSAMNLEALESSFNNVSQFKMLSVAFGADGWLGTLSNGAIMDAEKNLMELIQIKLDNYIPRKKNV